MPVSSHRQSFSSCSCAAPWHQGQWYHLGPLPHYAWHGQKWFRSVAMTPVWGSPSCESLAYLDILRKMRPSLVKTKKCRTTSCMLTRQEIPALVNPDFIIKSCELLGFPPVALVFFTLIFQQHWSLATFNTGNGIRNHCLHGESKLILKNNMWVYLFTAEIVYAWI